MSDKTIDLTAGRMAVRYADDSGDRLAVEFENNVCGVDVVVIRGCGDATIQLNRDDVPWMIAALNTALFHVATSARQEPSA